MFERIKQLDRQTLITLILAGVLGIFLFSAITGSIRQAGWNEGYTAGLLTNNGASSGEPRGESAKVEAPAVSPRSSNPASVPGQYPGGYYRGYEARGWGWHPFGFIGGFFRFLFFAFLFIMLFKLIAFRHWRMHGGPPWHHHRHGPWGQGPSQQPENQPDNRPAGQQPGQPVSNPAQPNDWVNV